MNDFSIQPNIKNKGFTLLLAALMSVVILMVGMTILSGTFRQVLLSDIAVDSERAFHAAQAGIECAQFWNIDDVWDVSEGVRNIECAGLSVATNQSIPLTNNADEITQVTFDWSTSANNPLDGSKTEESYRMCSVVTVYKYFDAAATTDMTILPSFPNGINRTCTAGVECTVVVSRGYNRACNSISNIRTTERALTARF